MTTAAPSPFAKPVMGDEVAAEVLQWIGAFTALSRAFVISFNMQDYDFWGYGRLSALLLRQLAYGAKITLMTTPPPGQGGGQKFREKYTLLEELVRNGVDVYLNDQLHAKAYLFIDDRESKMTIVGSANLTSAGFGSRTAPQDDLLELALLTPDPDVHGATVDVIEKRLLADINTSDFATWTAKNLDKIARAKGGP